MEFRGHGDADDLIDLDLDDILVKSCGKYILTTVPQYNIGVNEEKKSKLFIVLLEC
jgi:hypothetical protein